MRIRLVLFLIISSFCLTSQIFAEVNISVDPNALSNTVAPWLSDQAKTVNDTKKSIDTGMWEMGNTLYGISYDQARSWSFSYTDIPNMIVNIIKNLLALTGGICVVALIYHALRMQLASGVTGDSSQIDHAKDGIRGSIIGFILSMSAWFLMTKFVEILSNVS